MVFEAHGSYDLGFRGEIFFLRFKGNWNLEQGKAFFAAYKTAILEQGFERFGVVTDFCSLEGATPDCIVFFNEVVAWAAGQGQVARAQILNSELRAYMADLGTVDKGLFLIRSFENETEALDWLAGLGLKIS